MRSQEEDRTQYYKEYYFKKKDLRKYLYYEKREKDREMKKVYEDYGGERKYYIMKMKEFTSR